MPTFRDSPVKIGNLLVQPFSPCCLSISVLHSLKCPCIQHTSFLLRDKTWTCEGTAKLAGERASRNFPGAVWCSWTGPWHVPVPCEPVPSQTAPGIQSHSIPWINVVWPVPFSSKDFLAEARAAPCQLAWKCSPACFIYYDKQSAQTRIGDPALGTSIPLVKGG